MNTVYFSLGSNMGDKLQWLRKAIVGMRELGDVTSISYVYETAAWGVEEQEDFLNIAICLETELDAVTLLGAIQQIEQELGRVRSVKWGARTLDIDILLFNDDIITTAGLNIPHPFMQERRFVLVPLAEIAANVLHPVIGKTIAELLAVCADKQAVVRVADNSYL